MYPRSFLCEEAKIKQRTSVKEELCEIGEEAIWEPRFTSFLISLNQGKGKIKVNVTPKYNKLLLLLIFNVVDYPKTSDFLCFIMVYS